MKSCVSCGEKIPLLQFNRTALRSAWFKANYPDSLNIYLFRDPRDQWQSYAAIRARKGYDAFFLMDVMALSKNRDNALIRPLRQALPLLAYHAGEHSGEEALYRILYNAYSEWDQYLLFYYLWLLSLFENARHADALWDINELAESPEYRGQAQQWLADRGAAGLDFGDCRITRYSSLPLAAEAMAVIEARAWDLLAASRPRELWREAAGRLPARIAGRLLGSGEGRRGKNRPGAEEWGEANWKATMERMAKWLLEDWCKEVREIQDLQGKLRGRNESISLITGLVMQEIQEKAVKQLDADALKRIQDGIEGVVHLLRDELAQKERKIVALTGTLAEREEGIGRLREELQEASASASLLQAKVGVLQRSHSFRLGRAVLLPLRAGKTLVRKLQEERTARSLPRRKSPALAATFPAEERKVSLIGQMHLDFGRHRSGLKYGLQFLLGLHHPQGAVLDAFIERTFSWQPDRSFAYEKPWIGFIHVPPCLPEWFHMHQSNQAIFLSKPWQKSLPWCRGLFAFSRYHQKSLQPLLPFRVDTLLLPTETPRLKWSPERFAANKNKQVVQVGWWLRRLHAIYQLPKTDFAKALLDVAHHSLPELWKREKEVLAREGTISAFDFHSVSIIPYLANREYDRLLSQNVVFLHLYDSSACNAIVECMVRQTPLLVNPLPAVVEYLGEEYPFYFQSLAEAAAKLMDRALIIRTHEYLKGLARVQELNGDSFCRAFAGSMIYRSLPIPAPRSTVQ